jgi:hypothetical protein
VVSIKTKEKSNESIKDAPKKEKTNESLKEAPKNVKTEPKKESSETLLIPPKQKETQPVKKPQEEMKNEEKAQVAPSLFDKIKNLKNGLVTKMRKNPKVDSSEENSIVEEVELDEPDETEFRIERLKSGRNKVKEIDELQAISLEDRKNKNAGLDTFLGALDGNRAKIYEV